MYNGLTIVNRHELTEKEIVTVRVEPNELGACKAVLEAAGFTVLSGYSLTLRYC